MKLFCHHEWEFYTYAYLNKVIYGCEKCGRIKRIPYHKNRTFEAKQHFKGQLKKASD